MGTTIVKNAVKLGASVEIDDAPTELRMQDSSKNAVLWIPPSVKNKHGTSQ